MDNNCSFDFKLLFSVPKGEYTRTNIDRPYALPDDVATIDMGFRTLSTKYEDQDDLIEDDEYTYGSYLLIFENGIADNINWIYPLGLRWGIFENEQHTIGVSASYLFFFSNYSVDYWYRVNSQFSLRPYARGSHWNLIIAEEKKDYVGAEVMYQLNKLWSISLFTHKGSFVSSSDLIDEILADVLGSTSKDEDATGDLMAFGLSTMYSLNERWDINFNWENEELSLETEKIQNLSTSFSFTYIW